MTTILDILLGCTKAWSIDVHSDGEWRTWYPNVNLEAIRDDLLHDPEAWPRRRRMRFTNLVTGWKRILTRADLLDDIGMLP